MQLWLLRKSCSIFQMGSGHLDHLDPILFKLPPGFGFVWDESQFLTMQFKGPTNTSTKGNKQTKENSAWPYLLKLLSGQDWTTFNTPLSKSKWKTSCNGFDKQKLTDKGSTCLCCKSSPAVSAMFSYVGSLTSSEMMQRCTLCAH